MEAKTIAFMLVVILTIILFFAVVYKIKKDKKRKSFRISTDNRQNKSSFWESSPLIAFYVLLVGFIIVFIIPEDWIKIETLTDEALVYIIWGVVNSICCFFITRQNPKSIWYVPLIINSILTALIISTQNFWENILLISLFGIWVISIIASITGAWQGKRKIISENTKL